MKASPLIATPLPSKQDAVGASSAVALPDSSNETFPDANPKIFTLSLASKMGRRRMLGGTWPTSAARVNVRQRRTNQSREAPDLKEGKRRAGPVCFTPKHKPLCTGGEDDAAVSPPAGLSTGVAMVFPQTLTVLTGGTVWDPTCQ